MARKLKTSKQIIDQLSSEGVSPAEVMVKTMRRLHKTAEDLMDELEFCHSDEKRASILKLASECMEEACEIAKNVAPYFHAKQQSVVVSGDDEKPAIQVELKGVAELRKLIRGRPVVVPLTSVKDSE